MEANTARFTAALQECGISPADKESVRFLYDRFMAPISAQQLASEFGKDGGTFLAELKTSSTARLRSIASRLEAGTTLPRQQFVSNFRDIVEELNLGTLTEFLPPPFEEFGGAKEAVSVKTAKVKPSTATKERPFVNSLGMKFVPVVEDKSGKKVLFSIWETRRQDYAAYAEKKSGVDQDWKSPEYRGVPVGQKDEEPVVNVSWNDAVAFCAWLTEVEREAGRIGPRDTYQLPSDREWSIAVGIGDVEPSTGSPESKNGKLSGVYPWGGDFPPPDRVGNYADTTTKTKFSNLTFIEGYTDGFASIAPVGAQSPNKFGLYDLGGNVWEWCANWYDEDENERVLRGGSRFFNEREVLASSFRGNDTPGRRSHDGGFRCVVAVNG